MSDIRTCKATEILGFVHACLAIKDAVGQKALLWRGHGDQAWKLESSLHRIARIRQLKVAAWERTLVSEFLSESPARSGFADPIRHSNWLVVMRHHGLPSRLLDWTWNPLVACYFAAAEAPDADAAIWALEPMAFNASSGITTGMCHLAEKAPPVSDLVNYPFTGDITNDPEGVFACAASHCTPRIFQQAGSFTLHGARTPIESMPGASDWLLRIVIPASSKPGLLKDLEFIGISRKSLFPDLDSLAQVITHFPRPPDMPGV